VIIDSLMAALVVWGATLVPALVVERVTRKLRQRPTRVRRGALVRSSTEMERAIGSDLPDERALVRRIEDLASDHLIRESGCRPPE
jgi:hypothetical protein